MTTRLSVAARSDVGRVRAHNEDAFLVADVLGGPIVFESGIVRFEVGGHGALLAVSDGMGGHKAGEVASAMTLASLHRSLVELTSVIPSDARIHGAAERANADVFAAGQTSAHRNMGATLTAVLVDDVSAHIAEIGDSRAYLLRDGAIRQLTKDQSYVQALVAAGTLTPEQARSSEERNMLLQAVGQAKDVVVALSTLALRQRDCLLLCSDGLTLHLTDEEIRDAVLGSADLAIACQRLITLANERGGEDNVTVLLAGVGGDVPPVVPDERISKTHQILRTFEPVE